MTRLPSRAAGKPPRARRTAVAAVPAGASTRQSPGDRAAIERLTRAFRALGDPTRSRIVLALSRDEHCVSALAEIAGLSLSATSHQLRILRDLDLVTVRRAGKNHLYALNEGAFGFCSPRSCQAWRSALDADDPCR